MRKENLFLILSGCATAIVGVLYLYFLGFEKSRFRVDVPEWSGPSWKKPAEVSLSEFMNGLLSIIDWVILIGIAIIVVLIVLKVVEALIASLFRRKQPSPEVDTPPEFTEQ